MGLASISLDMRQWLHKFFISNYNILLVLLFFLFVLRPYDHSALYTSVWKSFLTIALLIAISNCSLKRFAKQIISLFAIPVIAVTWIHLFVHSETSFIAASLLMAVFMAMCTCFIIYDVLIRARVTLETLRGVVCAYFLVAFIFAYIYLLLEYLQPGTFQVNGKISSFFAPERFFSYMLYFSFVTALTVGFGDIVPIQETGQTFVVIEGIIGQFYVAILVARIVSVYSLYTQKKIE